MGLGFDAGAVTTLNILTQLRSKLPFLGDIASILGFLVSLYVLASLRGIRREFLAKGRLPKLIKDLKAHAREANDLLNNYNDSKQSFRAVLTKCVASLDSLRGKTPRDSRRRVKVLRKKMIAFGKRESIDAAWDIYGLLQALIEFLQNQSLDSNWKA